MANEKVFIGVGHGGNDPGAVANNLTESSLNLKVALKVDRVLKYHGVNVLLSRYREENDPLEEEIRECNTFSPLLAVDLHVNAGGGDGFEVFHTKNGGKGKELASNINSEVIAIGQNSRGLKTKLNQSGADFFGFIRSINCPSIICEMAFIDNMNDIKDFDEDWEHEKYAVAVSKGILKTLGIAYKGDGLNTSSTTPPSTEFAVGTYQKDVTIVADSLNVRSGRGTSYSVIGQFKKGQIVNVWYIDKASDGALWGSCSYSGKTGFIHMGYATPVGASQPAPPPKPSTPTPPPAPSCDKEVKRYSEKGKCTIVTKSGIRFRDKPCTCHGVQQGTYAYKESVYYDLVVITDKYVWISWIGASSGTRRYMPVKDRKTNERWGSCS